MLSPPQIQATLRSGLQALDLAGKNVLLLVPDATRTAPVAGLVKQVRAILDEAGAKLDVLIALGTHQPMSREAICHHFETDSDTGIFNHRWDDKSALAHIGDIPASTIRDATGGLMDEAVPITVNRMVLDHDYVLILGPVFPHETAGFSGGSKYLFPGVAGPEIIDFFHWLGAVVTILKTIGVKDNPVRRVLDQAAKLVSVPVAAISLVVHGGGLEGVFVGPTSDSWSAAVDLSSKLHVVRKPRRFHRVLACAARMYDDLWTGAKAMYKCDPIVADGGELIIYAPHITSFSYTHGHVMTRIGYHVRDYFIKQPDRFRDVPRAPMAVSTCVKGAGTYKNGIERPRIRVSLATGIPRDVCESVNLGYVDPASVDFDEWREREEEGILFVEHAGETLYLPEDRED